MAIKTFMFFNPPFSLGVTLTDDLVEKPFVVADLTVVILLLLDDEDAGGCLKGVPGSL